jgi:23S rRNA (uracil1939-C5)-methyltransferase
VQPGCPVFGRCGGCDWQHISYEAQLRQKVAMVEDALRRTGGLAFPGLAIEAGKPWRYRNRIQIHRGPSGEGGFLARTSHALVPVSTCPVAGAAFDALLAKQGTRGNPGEGRRYTAWTHPLADGAGDFLISEEGAEDTAGEIDVAILGKTLRFDLRCFFQSNLEMVEKLIPFALEGLGGGEALDLYCGVGLFGAFLKDRFESVLAVEENPISLEYALRNIGDTHRFLRGRLEDLLREERGYLAGCRPDAIVVDPPRDGLDRAVKDFLIAKRPPKLVYVSCNPVTLARDLKSLLAEGFVLDDLRLFDFYPQTAHVEAVAKLSMVK